MNTKGLFLSRRRLLTASAAGLAFGATGIVPQSFAQPGGRTTRILVGFPAGGAVDFVARLLANEIRDSAVIVENRSGAGGRLALEGLKSSIADGSTMILTPAATIVVYPHIYKALKYDAFADFTPITKVCDFAYLLAVGPMMPGYVKTLIDFIAWCRANPGRATYGTAGAGTPMHFTGVMLSRTAGFELTHVPYQGAAPAVQNLLGGQIAAAILPIHDVLSHIQSGKVRALTTTGPRRSSWLPEVPTVKEAGYPSLEFLDWVGVFLPAKTPAERADNLDRAIREVLQKKETEAALTKLSFQIAGDSQVDFARLIKSEFQRWHSIVQASGFTPLD
jgi:tripartite-type tricarboxylate transporter receptor subunit TctC